MSVELKPETNQQYHADTSHVSASMLKALAKSPRIYEATYVTGEIDREETQAMKIGTAVHCAALEPDEWEIRYPQMPAFELDEENVTTKGKRSKSKNTTYYNESVERWQSENAGAIILTKDERETVYRCLFSLRGNPTVKQMLDAPGLHEESVRVIETLVNRDGEEIDIPCKIRLDKVFPEQRLILDVKTITECEDRKIAYQCQDFGYDIQESHYRNCAAMKYGGDADEWKLVFAFVETKRPNRDQMVSLCPLTKAEADEKRRALLVDWYFRMETGDWSEPGENEIKEITIPSLWRKKRNGE